MAQGRDRYGQFASTGGGTGMKLQIPKGSRAGSLAAQAGRLHQSVKTKYGRTLENLPAHMRKFGTQTALKNLAKLKKSVASTEKRLNRRVGKMQSAVSGAKQRIVPLKQTLKAAARSGEKARLQKAASTGGRGAKDRIIPLRQLIRMGLK